MVLRKCRDDFTPHEGFKYPEKGYVEALDWRDSDKCGNGLHGLEWGVGDYPIDDHGNMWQIIKVDKNNGYRDLGSNVKFKCGEVILSTLDQKEAMDLLMKYVPIELKSKVNYQVVYSEASLVINCGFCSIITSGFYSTITSGDWSTISTGYNSTIISEDCSTIISGNNSTITSGYESIITSGKNSTVIINGDYVIFTLGKGSRVITYSSTLVEGIDFKADEKVIVRDGRIIKGE